jgi:6-phosphogluconate dehydrogenase
MGWVVDSSEGCWTALNAIDEDVALPMIALSLFARFRSRVDAEGRERFAELLLAALNNEFGGHAAIENCE